MSVQRAQAAPIGQTDVTETIALCFEEPYVIVMLPRSTR